MDETILSIEPNLELLLVNRLRGYIKCHTYTFTSESHLTPTTQMTRDEGICNTYN